ncbi:MAG TPA: fumarylacetoacetate hydrolase family protein [Pelagibacterium sp.]|uniref:fumarylacetoacetate hydrolase family protein n=1 Tax=Pelagibacterium sp. TaxID=1967288 RepID=UPI002B995C79|nr:fumarylacetoacetate hydrolase family protein [Pelagibacterium sp.]HWJ88137.1 fumarylacetoacetate hydrolase family protein [Pelagibacterium sp.]
MKLVSFRTAAGQSFGALTADGIVDLGRRTGFGSLKALLTANALDTAHALVDRVAPDFALDAVTLLPVIPDPERIICVGLNYHDHVEETGFAPTERPTLFTRFASTLTGHDAPLVKPAASEKFDYEGELAVIVGSPGRHIAADDALSHVAGYAPFNDGSVRDWQMHTSQFTPGKNFSATGGFGPALVTPDEAGPLDDLVLRTRFNGTVVQEARLGQMITPIADLIAYISTFTPLVPGDVIVTGTPGGVGVKRSPRLYMKPGDIVEVEIDRIGLLRNPVLAEDG